MNFKFWQRNTVTPVAHDPAAQGVFNAVSQTFRRLFSGVLYGQSPDGSRDYNTTFGYPESLSYQLFYGMFRRGGIANTVVAKVAKACWRDVPQLMVGDEDVGEEIITSLKNIGAFKYLERADILNRIGNFSILLVGVPDGMELNQPLGSARDMSGVYFMPYSYEGITILKWDTEPTSPRHGQPEEYQVRTVNLGDKEKETTFTTRIVHWSRIVHLAEGALDSDVEGASALMPVFNALLDKDKVRGASSESFYRNARRVFALEAEKDARLDMGLEAKQAFQDEINDFNNGFQDFIRLQGMKANQLQPGLFSPRDSFDIAVEEIAGTTGIPIRILTGKGGGQLAGAEDRASWNSLVTDRQDAECSPWLLRTLQILHEVGLIDLPDDAVVAWPPQKALSESEEAEVAQKKGAAFASVANGLSTIAGDTIDQESAMSAVGLDGIEEVAGSLPDDNEEGASLLPDDNEEE